MLDEERVWSMHCLGKTASEIDEAMRLEPGTARRVIAEKWADAAFLEDGAKEKRRSLL